MFEIERLHSMIIAGRPSQTEKAGFGAGRLAVVLPAKPVGVQDAKRKGVEMSTSSDVEKYNLRCRLK